MKFLTIIMIMMASLGGVSLAQAQQHYNYGNTCEPDEICYQDNALEPLVPEAMTMHEYGETALQSIDVAESISSLPRRIAPHGERVFVFSPRLLRWAAYDAQGYRVAGGKANGGSSFCTDIGRPCLTPAGTHRVQSKGTAACVSRKFPVGVGGAPMPYCMFFRGGYAIHGSPYISNNNTSHGCIRVHTGAARWLHRHFMRPGTKVIVLSY